MIFSSILLPVFISASSAQPAAAAPRPIVVTGAQIGDKKAALSACLARNCPPNEEIDASLALAETQLLAGKYHDARATLLSALGRNKKEAMEYPIPVSDLYRANGRVAAHLGFDEDYYRSTWGIYNTLKKGLPDAVDRQYSAMMEVAEMMATTRGHDTAREYYRSIAYHARKDGRPDIAALAELRMILRHWPAYAREKAVEEIANSADPKTRAAQLEARLALARMAFEKEDVAKADAIVGELARYDIKRPILIYAPAWAVGGGPSNMDPRLAIENMKDSLGTTSEPGSQDFKLAAAGPAAGGQDPFSVRSPYGTRSISSTRMGLNTEDMWMDVGFHILPNGKVSDVQVLRSRGDKSWARPLLESIAGRRYTPPGDGAAAYRTERYTYTSGLEQGTGSHRSQHSPDARVEYFDLSDIAAPN